MKKTGDDSNAGGEDEEDGGKDASNPKTSPGTETKAKTAYAELFCTNVSKVKTKIDVTAEISHFCKDGAPTTAMKTMLSQLTKKPGRIDLALTEKETGDSDRSEFLAVWGYRLTARPIQLKDKPLYQFIAKPLTTDALSLNITAERQADTTLESAQHIWSANLHHELTVKATPSLTFQNQRDTQYNLYQLIPKNDEMGFAVEAMVTPNEFYFRSVMINLSFNDSDSIDDGKGGSYVLTLLHLDMNNRGFPASATSSTTEIAKALDNSMFDGLK